MLPTRRGSKTKLDEVSDDEEECDIYEELCNDEINQLIRKAQQRSTSLSKTKGDPINELIRKTQQRNASSGKTKGDPINQLVRKTQQRSAALSKTKGDPNRGVGAISLIDSLTEGLASPVGSIEIKYKWLSLSLMGLFSIIGLLAVLNSKSVRSFSPMSKSVDGKLATVDSERAPTDMLFFWHLPRSAGTTFQIIGKCYIRFYLR